MIDGGRHTGKKGNAVFDPNHPSFIELSLLDGYLVTIVRF